MRRLNNHGQSLVLFVLMLPLLLAIMALVIDCGNALVKKNDIDNVIELVLNTNVSSADNSSSDAQNTEPDPPPDEDEDKEPDQTLPEVATIEALLAHNLKDCTINVTPAGDTIDVTVDTYVQGIFSNILNLKGFPIKSEYSLSLDNNQKIIKKIK